MTVSTVGALSSLSSSTTISSTIKEIIVPRQARDKHRLGNVEKKREMLRSFLQVSPRKELAIGDVSQVRKTQLFLVHVLHFYI